MLLCTTCQNIFDRWYLIREDSEHNGFPYHEDIFALQAYAKNGCALCTQFFQDLVKNNHSKYMRLQRSATKALEEGCKLEGSYVRAYSFKAQGVGNRDDCWLLSLLFLIPLDMIDRNEDDSDFFDASPSDISEEDMSLSWVIEEDTKGNRAVSHDNGGHGEKLEKKANEENGNSRFGSRRGDNPKFRVIESGGLTIIPTTQPEHKKQSTVLRWSKDSLSQAKLWLETCCTEHRVCNTAQHMVPTRLVFIEHDKAKLCITATLAFKPKYATLSHCWGSLRLRNLTHESLEEFCDEIPPESLSTSFREAMDIALILGLEYIWIDSLCIIQGDEKDWRKESALMSSVYGGSTVNIAATSAEDGNRGCLVDRDPDKIFTHQVSLNFGDRSEIYDCVAPNLYSAGLDIQPLAHRGWVVQERFLSPRILHFSSSQLFWECNETVACETYPEEFPDMIRNLDFAIAKQPIKLSLWAQIVMHYTVCDLTEIRDKLVAISGVARRIQNQTNDDYLAGLWRTDLEIQLCWRALTESVKPNVYLGPSWSWAGNNAYGCRILTREFLKDFKLYVRVINAYTVYIEPNSLGEVSDGSLELHCKVLIFTTWNVVDKLWKKATFIIGEVEIMAVGSYDFSWPEQEKVYILPVILDEEHQKIRGLILLPTGQRGQYRRIGQFEVEEDSKLLKDLLQLELPLVADSAYRETCFDDGKRSRTIQII